MIFQDYDVSVYGPCFLRSSSVSAPTTNSPLVYEFTIYLIISNTIVYSGCI